MTHTKIRVIITSYPAAPAATLRRTPERLRKLCALTHTYALQLMFGARTYAKVFRQNGGRRRPGGRRGRKGGTHTFRTDTQIVDTKCTPTTMSTRDND